MEYKLDWYKKFRDTYRPLFGSRYDAFEAALKAPKLRHVRLNSSRNINYFDEIESKSHLKQLPGLDYMYKVLTNPESITGTISFQTGGAYIMNPSSVIPVLVLSSFLSSLLNPIVLDVSAAPGGKTCALSDCLNRRGVIVANEFSSTRLKSLHFNLEKYGCYNVKTISADGRLLNKFFKNTFDGILLDAPCSNENKIFRNKTVQAQWSEKLVQRMAELQKQLISSAYECLAPGGILVYSTCTMSLEENEQVIRFVLDKFQDLELLHIEGFEGYGLSGVSNIDENVVRVVPDIESMDGFFVAAVRKSGKTIERNICAQKLTNKQIDFFNEYYKNIPNNICLFEKNNKGYMSTQTDLFDKMYFKKDGITLYKSAGKNYEPASQGLWELGNYVLDEKKTFLSAGQALDYLKGFDINNVDNYNNPLLFCGDLPVGYGKLIGSIVKNKLDRYFLYSKNIEW